MSKEEEKLYKYVKDNYWSKFRRNTTILSSSCRQLALGMGALLWAEKDYSCLNFLPKFILILLVFFFLFDASQYLYQSYRYHILATKYDDEIERKNIQEIGKLIEEPGMNSLTNRFFVLKLSFLVLAAILFIILLFNM